MNDQGLPDFTGKTIILYFQNAPEAITNGAVLEDVSFQMIGGRLFVVGRNPEDEDEWDSGLRCAFVWDAVIGYMIYESAEDYQKSRERMWKE